MGGMDVGVSGNAKMRMPMLRVVFLPYSEQIVSAVALPLVGIRSAFVRHGQLLDSLGPLTLNPQI